MLTGRIGLSVNMPFTTHIMHVLLVMKIVVKNEYTLNVSTYITMMCVWILRVTVIIKKIIGMPLYIRIRVHQQYVIHWITHTIF